MEEEEEEEGAESELEVEVELVEGTVVEEEEEMMVVIPEGVEEAEADPAAVDPAAEDPEASETEAPDKRPVPHPTGLPLTITVSVGSVVSPVEEAIVKRVVQEV